MVIVQSKKKSLIYPLPGIIKRFSIRQKAGSIIKEIQKTAFFLEKILAAGLFGSIFVLILVSFLRV